MPLAIDRKKSLIEQFRTHEGDTGSPEVQIALLSERINSLTDHFKQHTGKVSRHHRQARHPPLTAALLHITDRSSDGTNPGAPERADREPAPHGVRRIPADTRGQFFV